MGFDSILQKPITSLMDSADVSDRISNTKNFSKLIRKIADLLGTDIKIQDFIIVVETPQHIVDFVLTFDDLQILRTNIETGRHNLRDFDHTQISDVPLIKNFRKGTYVITDKTRNGEVFDRLTNDKSIDILAVVDEHNQYVGKIKRNNFVNKLMQLVN